jgi:hypothetical protein
MYDEECNLLDEKPIDAIKVEQRKKITVVRNKEEYLIQKAKSSNEGLDFLVSNVTNIESCSIKLYIAQCKVHNKSMEVSLVIQF